MVENVEYVERAGKGSHEEVRRHTESKKEMRLNRENPMTRVEACSSIVIPVQKQLLAH